MIKIFISINSNMTGWLILRDIQFSSFCPLRRFYMHVEHPEALLMILFYASC